MWNGTMFVDLDWPLNASSLLSASAELLVFCVGPYTLCTLVICTCSWYGHDLLKPTQPYTSSLCSVNSPPKKSQSVFSAIAFDQAHEQLNKIVKGDGGIIGLTENERTLSQLLITAPETARLIGEFESGMKKRYYSITPWANTYKTVSISVWS